MTTKPRGTLEEAAPVDAAGAGETDPGAAASPRIRRTFNEAAHKLGHWRVEPAPARVSDADDGSIPAADADHDVVAHAARTVLALGALGVVYGDIGTSPLYTEQTVFTAYPHAAHTTPAGVYGIASLIFWTLTVIVSIKYAGFIMRAHNRGDGGIMALTALVQRLSVKHMALFLTLGIFGASLFFGDGMVTPAISVISAVEGLNIAAPALSHLVVPISLAILLVLFAIQRKGTGAVGWLFGPVMLFWFLVLGIVGARELIPHPSVLQGLSPVWAARYMIDGGSAAWLSLGGVVLCCTGAEALYADRGHFGAGPIRSTWYMIVFPCLMLNYLGQAALILQKPSATQNPFLLLVPHWGQLPMVFLATIATVIASQAVITGSFSVARQAVQLGFLPRMRIKHTSRLEGQIYVPIVNWALCLGVAVLVLVFRSSARLADMYGVAVTGTFILNTVLFLAVARALWHTAIWKLALLGGLFLFVEVAFFSANIAKIAHGAYLPLAVGLVISALMLTWRRGRDLVTRNRTQQEGSLKDFLAGLRTAQPPIVRLPGTAIFLSPGKETTPLALRAQVEHNHALHEKVVIVSADPVGIPHVPPEKRFVVERLGQGLFKVAHVTIRQGYQDAVNVPADLALARKAGKLERNLDLEHASYFVSRMTIVPSDAHEMHAWRKKLFIGMSRNAASPIEHFGLPSDRTVIMGSEVSF